MKYFFTKNCALKFENQIVNDSCISVILMLSCESKPF